MVKRIICLTLTIILMVSMFTVLSGCGNTSASGDEYVYVPEYIKITGEKGDGISNACYSNGVFYFSSMSAKSASAQELKNDTAADDYTYAIYEMGIDGVSKRLDMYTQSKLPEGKEGYVYLNCLDADDNGNIVCVEVMNTYTFDAPNGVILTDDNKWQYETDDNQYIIYKYDAEGNEVYSKSLTDIIGANSYFNVCKCDNEGFTYILDDQSIYVLDINGDVLYKYETENWINGIVKLSSGTIGFVMYEDSGTALYGLDNGAKTAKKVCDIPSNMDGLYSGNSEFDAYYNNGAFLYGINTSSGETSKILNWISCNIDNSSISCICTLEDGRIACITNNWNDKTQETESELVLLSKTSSSSVENKKVLTLATQYLDYDIKGKVIDFNKNNPNYRIEVKDYSEYNTDEDYNAGLKKMRTEILSGDAPDIIYMSGVNESQFAAKGLLEDLGPYIDNDPKLNRSDIMDNILGVMQDENGHIYESCSNFSVLTVMGPADIVGSEPGWTVDELLSAYEKMPEGATIFDEYATRNEVLLYCLSMDMENYVNWETGKCNFDNVGFVKLLDFVNRFPVEYDWSSNSQPYVSSETKVSTGKQMLVMSSYYSFEDYQYNNCAFNGKMTCIGLPCENGIGNMLQLRDGFSISSKCSDKDGAWQFIRQFFTADYQKNSYDGFPTNKEAFQAGLKEAMTPTYQTDENGNYILDKNGNKIEQSKGGMGLDDGTVIEFYSLKQNEADALLNIINSTTKRMILDENINEIINDECEAYFNGQKSAEETAKLVQSRVSIYVSEQS